MLKNYRFLFNLSFLCYALECTSQSYTYLKSNIQDTTIIPITTTEESNVETTLSDISSTVPHPIVVGHSLYKLNIVSNDTSKKPTVYGRKGVGPPPKPVVGRKGVNLQDCINCTENLTNNCETMSNESSNSIEVTKLSPKDKPSFSTSLSVKQDVTLHYKPFFAIDDPDSLSSIGISQTPLIVGIILLLLLITAIAGFGYKLLTDVWTRRHYSRVDFLIEGMYDV